MLSFLGKKILALKIKKSKCGRQRKETNLTLKIENFWLCQSRKNSCPAREEKKVWLRRKRKHCWTGQNMIAIFIPGKNGVTWKQQTQNSEVFKLSLNFIDYTRLIKAIPQHCYKQIRGYAECTMYPSDHPLVSTINSISIDWWYLKQKNSLIKEALRNTTNH